MAGQAVRRSLDLTSWEAASGLISSWNASGEIGGNPKGATLIKDAVAQYLANAEVVRGSRPATLYKLRIIFEKQLLEFCKGRGIQYLKQLDFEKTKEFRLTWKDKPLAASKKLQRLRGFFYFCMRHGWIRTNPASEIDITKIEPKEVEIFSEAELDAILSACDKFSLKGIYGQGNRLRLRAFVLLLRYTGLRIGDAVSFSEEKLIDGRAFLRTQKTGSKVWVPLPASVIEALDKVPREGTYYFWSGRGLLKSAVADWQRSLRKVFELAKVKGHPHKFRHTAATTWLLKGKLSLEDVATLLGNSVKICEKHYSHWILERQQKLDAAVRESW